MQLRLQKLRERQPDRRLAMKVRFFLRDVLVDEGDRHGHFEFPSATHGHDLHVLAGHRDFLFEVDRVQQMFGREHQVFGLRQRCEPNSHRRIVGDQSQAHHHRAQREGAAVKVSAEAAPLKLAVSTAMRFRVPKGVT